MKDQYMRNQMKEAEEGEVTLDDLDSLKNDVSGLKFEVLSYVRCVPSTLDAMCKRQNQQLHEIDFLQKKQREQWEEMLAHETRMQEMRMAHSNEIAELRQRQDDSFDFTRKFTSQRLDETTNFQTQKAQENQIEAKEKINEAKNEQICKVNDIYLRQNEHFSALKEEQNLIKSVQKENADTASKNTLMLKELIDYQDQKTTQYKKEQDQKMAEMQQKQFELIESLRNESQLKHEFQVNNMKEIHNLQQDNMKNLHNEQITMMKHMETEYKDRLNSEVSCLKEFYETKMGEYLLAQQTIISDQSRLIKDLLRGIEDHFTHVSTNNSEKILESQKMIPNMFRNEARIVCQSMQDIYNNKPMSLPATPILPRERIMPTRLPQPKFRSPIPVNQVRPLSSHFDTPRSITGLSNYNSTSSLNSIGEGSLDSSFHSGPSANFNHLGGNSYSSASKLANAMAPSASGILKPASGGSGGTSWLPRFNKVKNGNSNPSSRRASTQQNGGL